MTKFKLSAIRVRSAACPWTVACRSAVWHRHATACRCRSEEHTSELQSLMRISYAVFCLKKKTECVSHTYLSVCLQYLNHRSLVHSQHVACHDDSYSVCYHAKNIHN